MVRTGLGTVQYSTVHLLRTKRRKRLVGFFASWTELSGLGDFTEEKQPQHNGLQSKYVNAQ